MKANVWMPLYIGDYLADTARLTTEQHGAYLLLIMDYWRNGPPPDDDAVLAQITRLSPDAWGNACSTLRAFFKQIDGHLHHIRIDKEIDEAKRKKSVAVAKADKAARARWHKDAPSNHQAMLEQCPSPSPSPIDTKSKALSGKPDDVRLSNGKSKFKTEAESILAFLNEKAGKRFPPTKQNLDFVAGRLSDGATVSECRQVIAMKCREWLNDADNKKYLRPATLFNATKFSQYVGELGVSE